MPVSISDVTVTGVVPEDIVDDFGKQQSMVRIFYSIGEFGPYNIVVPKVEVSAQRVLMDVRQDAQKYIDILNLQF